MKLTQGVLGLHEALARVLAECWHDGDKPHVAERWESGSFRSRWLDMAGDMLLNDEAHPLARAVDRVRREAFEAGGSPMIGVLLAEIQNVGPGEYQDGMSRAVELMSQEMAMHYGSIFESGVRVGLEQARMREGGAPGG